MAKAKPVPVFRQVSDTEVKITYRDGTYLLKEKECGFNHRNTIVNLLTLKGVETAHLKSIGYLHLHKGDGSHDVFLNNKVVSWEQCKQGAIQYLDNLLD